MKKNTVFSFSEIMHLAATIYGEARGEYYAGKVAVGWVVRNRAGNPTWWGKDIISVCTKAYQFSCWNNNDPNSHKVKHIASGYRDQSIMDDPVVQECMRAAMEVLLGQSRDTTDGADHYHHRNISPYWTEKQVSIGSIGNHKFYKLGSK